MTRKHWVVGLLTLACIGTAIGAVAASAAPKQQKLTNVTLQLKWVTQAQFAGYYAALDKGYYKDAGLNVNIKIGGPSITPERSSSGSRPTSASTGCRTCSPRAREGRLVSVAQVFARSGMTEITWKTSGITRSRRCAARRSASGAAATSPSSSPR